MKYVEVLDQKAVTKLIQSKGMQTMADLSEATGINRFTLTQIMTGGRRIVRGDTANKIKQYLAIKSPTV